MSPLSENLSFWESDSFIGKPDIAVIGSGIVGLNCALSIQRKFPGLKTVILERGILPSGASTKNAGFACFGSTGELLDDLAQNPEHEVFDLVRKRYDGLKRLRQNLGDAAIGFENHGGFEVFDDEATYHKIAGRLSYLNEKVRQALDLKEDVYKPCDEKISSFGFKNVRHLVVNRLEGQIDTGKMMKSLIGLTVSSGVTILNNIKVLRLEDSEIGCEIVTSSGNIRAGKVVVATNGFARELLPELNVQPARAQVIITKPIPELKLKGTFHYDRGYYYFRNVGNRVLFGGGRNLDLEGETTTQFGHTALIREKLENLLKEMILPGINFETEQKWSGIMGVGQAKKAIVKKVGENIFCAVRMGGMGVAIGSLVGEEAADAVLEEL